MVMKLKILFYACTNLRIKNSNDINIARLYSCVLSQLGPAVMDRTVAKMGMEFWMWLSQEEANKSQDGSCHWFKIRNKIEMTERIKSKSNCSTERPIVQKFIMFLRRKIHDSLTQTSRGLSSSQEQAARRTTRERFG